MQGVYLLHFDQPVNFSKTRRYGDERHYLGCSVNIKSRVAQHFSGEGSLMTKEALSQGIVMTLAAIYPIGLVNEEQILTRIGAKKFCPICAIEAAPPKNINKLPGVKMFRLKNNRKCEDCNRVIRAGTTAGVFEGKLLCYRDIKSRGARPTKGAQ